MVRTTSKRIVICGGGVAGVEALLALHSRVQVGVDVHLVAGGHEFVYEPLAVAAPFGLADVYRFDLAEIAAEQAATFHLDALTHVDGNARRIGLAGGGELAYDALVVAVGARRRSWLPGALHFGGGADVAAYEALLRALEAGTAERVCFVNPAGVAWTLPLYELALLTAAHVASAGIMGTQLALVTPEADPLAPFGPSASRVLRDMLADRGIALHAGVPATRIEASHLYLEEGPPLRVDKVVTLNKLTGPAIPGLPHDREGFIEVDAHSRVAGLEDVYAAGDGTTYPIKQGGIATQQADAAADAIAAGLGVSFAPTPIRPTLRGMLLTGIAPVYLRAGIANGAGETQQAALDPLWWPPSKIAARHLGPYLAGHSALARMQELTDRAPATTDPARVAAAHDEARALALVFAERDAADGHFKSALEWLEVIERLDGVLPPGFTQKRAEWHDRVAA
jgi:sulfide:quinone oxidoreductase